MEAVQAPVGLGPYTPREERRMAMRGSPGRWIRERSILYVFVAFVLGFTLPLCGCLGIGALTMVGLGSLAGQGAPVPRATRPAVAVIRLEGMIVSSRSATGLQVITPKRVEGLLDQAEEDPFVRAIVVRIDSPGGDVVASDEIYRMLLDTEKPVVVSMGSVAASGGYYIACGADYIVAHPDSLTGSIGVISQFVNAEGLMKKLGVEVVVIASGPAKDIGSPFREMTEEEQELWRGIIGEVYEDFVAVVAERRGLPVDRVRELADGRVYTGHQALEAGLVDELGTLEDAIAKAAELGGIEGEPEVVELSPMPSLLDLWMGFQTRLSAPSLEEVLGVWGTPSVQYRWLGP